MTDEAIITEVLVREGWPRFTDDPADRGGPTKGGITLADLAEWREARVTVADLQALEEPEARTIYLGKYITGPRFHLIPDAWVRAFVVDTGVLQGQGTAAAMLQRALGVPADGDLGPVTLASLAEALRAPRRLRLQLVRDRMDLLLDVICSRVPKELRQTTDLKYRHGWWHRVADFLD